MIIFVKNQFNRFTLHICCLHTVSVHKAFVFIYINLLQFKEFSLLTVAEFFTSPSQRIEEDK